MRIWKEVPSWFDLSNYEELINYTAREWSDEISQRMRYLTAFRNSNYEYKPQDLNHSLFCSDEKFAPRFFYVILKQKPLLCKIEGSIPGQKIIDMFKNLTTGFSSVNELDELSAYSFLLDSEKKTEIEKDLLSSFTPQDFGGMAEYIKHRDEVSEKYSQPIGDLVEIYNGKRFLEIDTTASDEQILKDFNFWFKNHRNSSTRFIKRNFSTQDFRGWVEAKILPYWDLITIAEIEKATIPNHVLGNALFPEVFDIDLTERIRKVTRKKCNLVFSSEVLNALKAQCTDENVRME